ISHICSSWMHLVRICVHAPPKGYEYACLWYRKTSMDAVLTNYPISRNFQQRLATLTTGDILHISLMELRQQPTFKLLTDLRSLRVENLFWPIEDENGSALLPVLKLVASFVPARHIYLVDADLRPQRISRLDAIGSVVRLAYASVVARTAVMRARH